jgi:uncharacterized protein YaeQ
MALKSTVFKAALQVADLDRNHFGEYALTLAQHPSETVERLMVRLLGFALYAGEDLRFGKGLSAEDEASLWEIDPTGVIRLWIEVGLPDEARLRRASGRCDRLVVIIYGSRAESWWKQNVELLQRYRNLQVLRLSVEDCASLAAIAGRNMKLTWTIQEGTIYLDGAEIRPIRVFG